MRCEGDGCEGGRVALGKRLAWRSGFLVKEMSKGELNGFVISWAVVGMCLARDERTVESVSCGARGVFGGVAEFEEMTLQLACLTSGESERALYMKVWKPRICRCHVMVVVQKDYQAYGKRSLQHYSHNLCRLRM